MTTPVQARHRKASRPLTPLSDLAPATRRGFAVAASSGLALTMIASGANAAGQDAENLRSSAGTLKVGLVAEAESLAASNAPIKVSEQVAADDAAVVTEVETVTAEVVQERNAVATGQGLIDYGMQFLGVPYVWGASSPTAFDCSGFVSYVYASIGVSIPHQSSAIRNMAGASVVSASEAQAGDIMWWPGHVGLYAGDGMVLESVPGGVTYRAVWGSPTYLRVL
ncbi:MAG: C40 family peptidase [Actinomyces urogenitalis]|uniref:NlpC/P60 family protein n=2 Tax=Actinomyces urogenitalis TaxID=103621 RepID=C0W427_9ACTO|nr:C40 family peptidase [Actinomyces urogenitalis]EEH66522.1 NlpC/P60 family protein [Actinomyces urogenitalis DSM 15434]MBS5977788.1 C40 family peptidase [Actinomyces urogenitalis]MDK8835663.1 C40 family peptidase [Actinomyces urogenitalis]MDU0973032.1 C40 family peptidase [Actinomyces urogenitalis]PKY98467.1 NlpC/P60 family protein [Actinomyces urogenitalis]